MKRRRRVKPKSRGGPAQGSLTPKSASKTPTRGAVISISPNICTEKRMCPKCRRGDRYGIPLHFILHYSLGSIETVCYRCGAREAEKVGVKLPATEEDIYAALDAPNSRLIRIGFKKMGGR